MSNYVTIKEPQFNCVDMDARLRTILIRNMASTDTYFSFTYKAKEALVRRAAEITPTTIETLIRMLPGTVPIIECIWHVFPEETMEKIIFNDVWKNNYQGNGLPGFIEDYCLKYGKSLLDKYDKVPAMVMALLARQNDDVYNTRGMDGSETKGDAVTPDVYVNYIKTIRRYPKRIKEEMRGYKCDIIENLGTLVYEGKLQISLPEVKEVVNAKEER